MTAIPQTPGVNYAMTISASHQGMAHFASTGPAGTICKGCAHYGRNPVKRGLSSCFKFYLLTKQWSKQHLPSDALSCRHFSAKSVKPQEARRA